LKRHGSGSLRVVSFGKTVRRRRQALGLTLEGLSERAKLSPNYLGTVETGRRDPSLSTVTKIAKALETTAAELLGGVKGLGPDGLEAGALVERLPAESRAPLLLFLRSLPARARK
jgi:transcriptional regulator with XRE-family HTH domain